MRILRGILVTSLVLAAAKGLLMTGATVLFQYLVSHGSPISQVVFYSGFLSLAGLVVDPLLIFLVMFLISRGLELSAEFRSVILTLFIGSFVGLYVGSLIGLGFVLFGSLPQNLTPWAFTIAISVASSAFQVTLIGFSAIAIGYFFRKPQQAT